MLDKEKMIKEKQEYEVREAENKDKKQEEENLIPTIRESYDD